MKKVKEDHVSPVTKVLVDKIHAGRKQDSKFWQSEFDNKEMQKEESVGGSIFSKILKIVMLLFVTGLLVVSLLVAFVYFRPNVFPSLTHSKIYQTLSRYLPESDIIAPLNRPGDAEQPDESDSRNREFKFSQEQINRAKKEVIESKNEIDLSTIDSLKKKFNKLNDQITYQYEIEFVSGGRVYSENVRMSGDVVTFENDRGLVVSIHKDDIKTMKRFPSSNNKARK